MPEPSLNIYSVLTILGAVQGIFLAVVLLIQKRANPTPNRLLSSLILTVVFSLGVVSLLLSKVFEPGIVLYPIATPLPILVGVLLYLYVKSVTIPDYIFTVKESIHFGWYLLHFLILVPFYFYSYDEQMDFIYQLYLGDPEQLERATVFFRVAIRFAYVIMSLRLLFKYRKLVKQAFSDVEEKQLNWLRNLIFAYFLLSPLVITFRILDLHIEVMFLIAVYLSIINYLIGFYFLKYQEIYSDVNEFIKKTIKYERSGLTKEKAELLKEEVSSLIESNSIYTEPKLTAKDLADRLGISTHILSELLNEYFKQSFYDFINSRRVEEAKKLLSEKESKNMTVLAVAFEVGFNSKSTFNSVFKKFTGMTPSQYKSSQAAA